MKKLILTTAALALTASMGMAQTVRMGTEGAYPPYNFLNDKGEVDGFERDDFSGSSSYTHRHQDSLKGGCTSLVKAGIGDVHAG